MRETNTEQRKRGWTGADEAGTGAHIPRLDDRGRKLCGITQNTGYSQR